MPLLPRFDAPGNATDFAGDANLIKGWSDKMSGFFDQAVVRVKKILKTNPSQFYNPLTTSTDAPSAERIIDWPGFPRALLLKHGADRRKAFVEAEELVVTPRGTFRPQDEYLEWHVTKNAAGKITRVDFTCEGPEYWEFLAVNAPGTLLSLYRSLADNQVQLSDLIVNGQYNRRNKWNTTDGAVHLTHPANTLNAEIFLAGDATVLRKKAGQTLTDADALIQCAKYGEASRSSDPRIGAKVNELARGGFAITLKNPVGLYIDGLSSATWKKPDGTPVGNYFRITRGSSGLGLRAVYEVPATETSAGAPFVVGDITISGAKIEFGGQIAEQVTMKLIGVACRQGQITSPSFACAGTAPLGLAPESAQTAHTRKSTL